MAEKDYYEQLKNESYKSMLNSEVQASIARDQAMKYTQQSLQNAGYGTQGMAESSNLGLQNQYQQALMNAQNNYTNQMVDIGNQQQQAQIQASNNEFQNLSAFMSGATDMNQINTILNQNGIKVNDGVLDFSGSNLTESDQRQLNTLYALYNAQNNNTTPVLKDAGMAKDYIKDNNGETGKFNNAIDTFYDEGMLKDLENKLGVSFENGDVFAVVSDDGKSYTFVSYENGTIRQISRDEYYNSNRRYDFRNGGLTFNGKKVN